MTTVIGVIIVCITAFLASAAYQNYTSQTIEKFTEPHASLNASYIKKRYERDGIAPCDILANNTATSSNYIDTLRIRKWRPHESETLPAATEHCYFFMDDNKRILATETSEGYAPVKDPLATIAACDKNDPLFKDSPIIADAFESNTRDKTHNLPYKKCVLKIDKTVAQNPDSKTQFWNQFGNNNEIFCKGIENTLQEEATAYKKRIDELSERLGPFRSRYTSTASLSNQHAYCLQTNANLRNTISSSNAELQSLQREISASNATYTDSISGLRLRVDESAKDKDTKSANLLTLENQLNQVLTPNIQALRTRIQDLTTKRDTCQRQFQQTRTTLQELQKEHEKLRNAYRNLNTEFVNCERSQRELKARLEEERPQLIDYQQKLQTLKDQLVKCRADTVRFTEEERFWKETLRRTQNDFNRCNERRGKLDASIASLKQTKEALLKEIEEIKRRCRDDQSNFNMAAVNIHREAAKEIITTEQQRCGASIAMRQRRVELLNELNGILNQANSCDRITTACKCFQLAGEFGWNDHGSGGSQLNTTSGRIVEIRRYVDGGAIYVKFVHTDGQQTRFYRVTNTRKKRGGGSFINIDAALQRASGAPIARLRMYKMV